MALYYSKAEIYREIDDLRHEYGIRLDDYPLDVEEWSRSFNNIEIIHAPFKSKGFYGMCMFGSNIHTITLNSLRGEYERRFDLAHELMHIRLHQDEKQRVFKCYEGVRPNQNTFYEYQANEGAAELLVPYVLAVADLAALLFEAERSRGLAGYTRIPSVIAEKYRVSETVALIRVNSLMYETAQYMDGAAMCELEILSKRAQSSRGIEVKSLARLAGEAARRVTG